MNYQYIHNPLGMAGLYISYGHVGAVSEKAGKYGTSHLMEHMICKNTDDMRDKLQETASMSMPLLAPTRWLYTRPASPNA